MAKTLKLFLEGILVEHPLQMLNRPNLITTVNPKSRHENMVRNVFHGHPNLDRLGSGVEANVSSKNSERHQFEDPNHVYKVIKTHRNPKNHGTYQFLTHAANSDNPYYPRIHSIKSYSHASGDTTHVIKMERLQSLHSLRNTEHDSERHSMLERMYHNPEKHSEDFFKRGLSGFGRSVYKGTFDDIHSAIKDPHLINALHHIHTLIRNHGGLPDLHQGNIMVRRTQHGLHPVITDPIVGSGG